MINITFEPKNYKVTLKGHAQATNDNGDDLVCASASMLFFTLCESIKQSEGLCRKKSIKMQVKEGDSSLSCTPLKDFEGNIQRTFWTILNGFDLLQRNYPNNVSFTVESGVEIKK